MTGIDDAALLAVVAIASALGASALPRASWPRRSPAAAILLWQALGLASGLAASIAALQARRRQRALLTLLAHGDPKVPGALVVDYPSAAAYCLPGLRSRSRIVVSVGALELLGRGELAAVLAHERAHLRERHDLVLLPFTALRRAFPRSATCTGAHLAVALLVEML